MDKHHIDIKNLMGWNSTIINENGDNVSAGEKQMICITRAILRVIIFLN